MPRARRPRRGRATCCWERSIPSVARSPPAKRERDFIGARRFVENLRRSELNYVRKSLGEFRQVIMSLVQNFHRAVAVEGEEDRRVAAQIDRLRKAIESNSIEQLGIEATSVASHALHHGARRASPPQHPVRGARHRAQDHAQAARGRAQVQ